MLDPLRAHDPRLSHFVDGLPRYRAWLERELDAARRAGPDTAAPVATASIYLGIKLAEADRYALSVVTEARTLPRKANALREYLLGWVRLSMAVDSFVFASYGALDALAQVVVQVCAVTPDEEVKFPALERLLVGASPGSAAAAARAVVLDTLGAAWFRDLRRLRNLINYRSVLPAAPGGGLPLGRARAVWPDPPLPALDRLDALAPYARDTLARVAATVEAVLVGLDTPRDLAKEPQA